MSRCRFCGCELDKDADYECSCSAAQSLRENQSIATRVQVRLACMVEALEKDNGRLRKALEDTNRLLHMVKGVNLPNRSDLAPVREAISTIQAALIR